MIGISYSNVSLWFARDEDSHIVTIDEVQVDNIGVYNCPICGSEAIPKAIKKGAKMTPHFAHIDKSKCNSETMIHWWFKHRFLDKGDKFTVIAENKKTFVVSEIVVEAQHTSGGRLYQPDITIKTTTGETVFFEMAYTNSKKVEEYLDTWIEFGKIVVEVDIKELTMSSDSGEHKEFKALYYDGKCYNTKRNDTYYNTVGKHKEVMLAEKRIDEDMKLRFKNLDWLWLDVKRYQKGEIDIETASRSIEVVGEQGDTPFLIKTLKRVKCNNILDDYIKYKSEYIINFFNQRSDVGLDRFNSHSIYCFQPQHTISPMSKTEIRFYGESSYFQSYPIFETSTDFIISDISERIKLISDARKLKELMEESLWNESLAKAVADINCLFKQEDKSFEFEVRHQYQGLPVVYLSYNWQNIEKARLREDVAISNDNNFIRREILKQIGWSF